MQSKENTMLCPSCMAENEPNADFCSTCGRPLGAFVNMDPIKRIRSQGWIYRKSVSGPVSPTILIGIWLIFGTALMLTLTAFLVTAGAFIVAWLLIPVYIIILYKVTKNYLDRSNKREEK